MNYKRPINIRWTLISKQNQKEVKFLGHRFFSIVKGMKYCSAWILHGVGLVVSFLSSKVNPIGLNGAPFCAMAAMRRTPCCRNVSLC